jgi:zinc/manganese transport system permease protein
MPAAAGQQITANPAAGVAISVGLAVLIAWLGVGLSFYFSGYPTGFFITTVGFAVYLTSVVARAVVDAKRRRVALPTLLSPA